MPMFEQLGYPSVFCNSLVVDSDGFICDHILRLKDQKRDPAARMIDQKAFTGNQPSAPQAAA